MELDKLVATERHLLSVLCSYTPTPEYVVYRSEKYPGFFAANGIEITNSASRSLADWEILFEQYFDPAVHRHKTFTFRKSEALLSLEYEAKARNYDIVQTSSWMYATTWIPGTDIPSNMTYGRLETLEDEERYRAFYHTTNSGEGWYTPAGCNRLFDKTMYVSRAIGITWLYIADRDTGEFCAVTGVFCHNDIGRLQDVATHPGYRRRGLASNLLRHVMQYAFEVLGVRATALCADNDYYAIDLYRKVGFVSVGETVDLMKY